MADIPAAGVALIKKFEGLRLEAYPDPLSGGKPYTIGYGSTRTKSGGPFAIGDKITEQEATDLLMDQIEDDFLPSLEKIPVWPTLNENQQGAVLSFAYNLGARFYGANNFETITRVLREKQWDQIEDALVLYRNRGTPVERGLLRRRLSEAELFLEGVPGEFLSPPGQQFLSGILEIPQQYFDAQADTFEPGERIVSVTRPFMRGDDIAIAQKTLVSKGYDIDADGIFGPASSAAVKDFQAKNDLTDNGILQAPTWEKLLAPEPDLSLELEKELASDLDLETDLGPISEPDLVLGLEPDPNLDLEPDPDLDLDLGLGADPNPDLGLDTDLDSDLANQIAELPDAGVKLIKTYEFGENTPGAEAEEQLLENIARALPAQKKIPNWSAFKDEQRGAIISFAYDVRTDFYDSEGFETLTRVLKDSQWAQLEAALVTHRSPETSIEAGLKRRLSEAELFLNGVPGESLSPPGQQFLAGVLETPQQYLDAQGETFEAGQRIVSVTRPFMRGDDIAVAQKALVKQGYDIDTDGIFGPASKAALADFQQKNGLDADGILAATTWQQVLTAVPDTAEPTESGGPDGSDLGGLPVIPISETPAGEPAPDAETEPKTDLAAAKWICTVQRDTVLKLRPEDTEQLTDAEKQAVTAGTTYGLQSYAYADPVLGDFNGHLKIALQNQTIKGFNTWFINGEDVQITLEGEVVYPWEEQQATFVLKVFRDTLLKRLPIQSSELSDEQKAKVAKNTDLELQSYAYQDSHGDFSNHIRIALKHQKDYLKGLSQWYVYDKHAYVEYDGGIVYPPSPLLKITQDTIIKRRPVQSSELPQAEKYIIPAGRAFILDSWAHQDGQGRSFNRHIKFAIKLESEFIEKISTWYVYDQHAQVIWNDKILYPPFRGNPFKLPGNETTFYTGQPIIKDSDFTWGEATKDGARLPANAEIVNNIIDLAQKLQTARELVGRPFVINSWYRTPEANRAVGGARNSLHLQGRAVDMYVPGYSVRQVANALMSSWPGGILIYSTHLHLDTGKRQVIFL